MIDWDMVKWVTGVVGGSVLIAFVVVSCMFAAAYLFVGLMVGFPA